MTKYRTPILDYDTAVDLANLCLMNAQKVLDADTLTEKQLGLSVAIRQYHHVRRYALDVIGWCKNTHNPVDFEPLTTAWIIRGVLNVAKQHLSTLEQTHELEQLDGRWSRVDDCRRAKYLSRNYSVN